MNSPGDEDGAAKVRVMDFPLLQSCPFISKTLHLGGTLWNDSLLATFALQKRWGRDCAHSGSWSIMMRFCLSYSLQEIFSYLFQKKMDIELPQILNFISRSISLFLQYIFYSMNMTDENRRHCFNCSNKMNHLFHGHFTPCKVFFFFFFLLNL